MAKTVRSTPTQVKKVAEAMVARAAKQLKAAGRFTIPGAFYMKLKKTPATPARIGVNKVTKKRFVFKAKKSSRTVQVSPMKKVERFDQLNLFWLDIVGKILVFRVNK